MSATAKYVTKTDVNILLNTLRSKELICPGTHEICGRQLNSRVLVSDEAAELLYAALAEVRATTGPVANQALDALLIINTIRSM